MRIAIAGGSGTVGRHVAAVVADRGHEAVVLSRSSGIDVRSGHGLAEALRGADTVIDTLNPGTTDGAAATAFFTEAAANLQRVGASEGVRHMITLSIVGLENAGDFGYYQAKQAHERAAAAGPVPVTIQRVTQFHEFIPTVLGWTRQGTSARIPALRVQPVAARTVAEVLVDLAGKTPSGHASRATDVAGPEPGDMPSLAAAFARRFGIDLRVEPDPEAWGIPAKAMLPTDSARGLGPTFMTWLDSPDAAEMAGAMRPAGTTRSRS